MINAHPSYPPLSLIVLYNMLSDKYRVLPACHSHSSVSKLGVSSQLKQAFGNQEIDRNRNGYQVALTLIWKDGKNSSHFLVRWILLMYNQRMESLIPMDHFK